MPILRCFATVTLIAITTRLGCDASFAVTADTTNPVSDTTINTGEVTISRDELIRLPFRTIEEIIGLQNGTTLYYQKPGGEFSLTVPQISIRGSQPFETGYYLNGIQMNDPYSGYFTARISPHALEYLTLDPAAFGSHRGFSGASAVQMITRRGGSRFSGMVESVSDNAFGSGFDQNWYTTSLGGPIPGVHNAYFFGLVERRYFGDRNPSIMTDDFLPENPDRLRGNWLDGWSYNGRLDYEPLENLSITATLDGSVTEWSEYIHAYYFDWQHLPYYKDESLDFSGRLHHQLTPTLEYSLQASYFTSERFRGDGVYREDLAAYRKPYANPEADAYQLFYDWDDMEGPTPDIDEGHAWDDYLKHKTSQVDINGAVSKEVGQGNKITLGGEYRRYAIRMYQNLMPTDPQGVSTRNVNHFGYDISGKESDNGDTKWGNEVKHPVEYGANLAGQLRFGDLELNLGIRLDIFDCKTLRLKEIHLQSGDHMILDLSDMGSVKTDVRWSSRLAFLYTPAETNLCLGGSLGWYYLPPPYSSVYSGWDFFEARFDEGSYYPHSDPAADPVKARSLELSLGYSVGKPLFIKFTGFGRDMNNSLGLYSSYSYSAWPHMYYFNGMSGWKALGLDLTMRLQFSDWFFVDFGQTWQSVETHGSLVRTPWHTADTEQPYSSKVSLSLVTGEDEGPALGTVHPFERLHLSLIGETCSGFPYTPVRRYDAVGFWGTQLVPTAPINSASSPSTSVFNLMIEREFKTSGFSITPFLWVRNLFNSVSIRHIYAGTGEADNTGYLETREGIERTDYDHGPYDNSGLKFGERYQLAQRDPLNYGAPRQILFGLRVSF